MADTEPGATGTTQDERTIALLAHMLQTMLWWIAPLVIFLIKRNSKFISFHALQALLLQVACMILMICGMIVWVGAFVFTAALGSATRNSNPPPEFFILMPMLWMVWMGIWVMMLLAAIVYGVRAGRGEWAEYPFFGELSRRILKLGPGGVPV